jgi:hypothetical protein
MLNPLETLKSQEISLMDLTELQYKEKALNKQKAP